MPVVTDNKGNPLPCYGCAHSDSYADWPSGPSGERPCLFCTRNPDPDAALRTVAEIRAGLAPGITFTARYDNGPTAKATGDQYIATDRLLRDLPKDAHVIT